MKPLREDTVSTTINGYTVELDFFVEGGEQRCFGVVNYTDADGNDYSASITLLEHLGKLDSNRSGVLDHDVAPRDIIKIVEWADDNGY